MAWVVVGIWGLLALVVCVVTLLSALPGRCWVLRVCDFPRMQMLGLGIACLVAAPFVASGAGEAADGAGIWVWIGAGVVLAATIRQAWWSIPLTFLASPEIRWSTSEQGPQKSNRSPGDPAEHIRDHSVRLITANVDYTNDDPAAAIRTLIEHRPHVLAMVETDERWEPLVEQYSDSFQWRVGDYRGLGFGMCLMSRLPILNSEIRCLVSEDRPSIWAEIGLPSGGRARLVVLHPPPPGLPRKRGSGRLSSKIRDVELAVVANRIAEEPDEAWIVAGDFNDVGWSHTTDSFKKTSRLRDPRIGRGMFSTFPSTWPIIRYPIDHVMLSTRFTVDRVRRLASIGSDHLPLLADIRDDQAPPLEKHDTLTYHSCSGETTSSKKTVEVTEG